MKYSGRFNCFDFSKITCFPIEGRNNRTTTENLLLPDDVLESTTEFNSPELDRLCEKIQAAKEKGLPVILFTGAHLIKNGMGLLLGDLIRKGVFTLVATNCAGVIHDFELALIGGTSEVVPDALGQGTFGMWEETLGLMNRALTHGNRLELGIGESLGRLISGEDFPQKQDFPFCESSVIHTAWETGIPLTVHVSIGTDIIDQYPHFDAAAKGGCSGRDFGIFAAQVARMKNGGVFINAGSAVTGPEVFLKACSMAANIGSAPHGITTAAFDLRPVKIEDISDEKTYTYYFRDIKSVVTRIPESFNGKGYYIQGDQTETFPALYRKIVDR